MLNEHVMVRIALSHEHPQTRANALTSKGTLTLSTLASSSHNGTSVPRLTSSFRSLPSSCSVYSMNGCEGSRRRLIYVLRVANLCFWVLEGRRFCLALVVMLELGKRFENAHATAAAAPPAPVPAQEVTA